jgi:hypothetical protein
MKGAAIFLCFSLLCACRSETDNTPDLPEPPTTSESPSPIVTAREGPRRTFAARIWKTSLGTMYNNYLFNTDDREALPARARQIVDRILSDPNQLAVRVSAMQIMNEDLYVGEMVDENVMARMSLLEDELNQARHKEKSEAVTGILEQIPIFFLATLPMGSPLIRSEMSGYFRQLTRRSIARIRRKELPPPGEVQWSRIMSSESLQEYEVGKALSAFSKTFAPISMVEWLRIQKAEDEAGESVPREEIAEAKDF